MTKNAFCFAGAMFSGQFVHWRYDVAAIKTFAAFCCVSASVYVMNDLLDRERDRQHPVKQRRPIASGAVGVPSAVLLAAFAVAAGFAFGVAVNLAVVGCLLLYILNNLVYSMKLKHLALLDVLSIALGFVLRMLAGVYAVDDIPTTWITLCTFFLCVFLGFSKRRAELAGLIPSDESAQRPALTHYTVQYLDFLTNHSAAMTIMTYALFTTSHAKNPTLVATVPVVFFAIMHYKRVVMLHDQGEEPERIVLEDPTVHLSIVVWLVMYFTIVYSNAVLFR